MARSTGGRSGSTVRGGVEVGLFLVTAPVLIETSDVTKTGLTGRVKGAAVTEQLHSATHAPLSPPTSRSFIPFHCCVCLCLTVAINAVVSDLGGSYWEV